ncbi:RNA 2'-phosphotransferase, partial [Halorussus sp. GCM10023401]
APRRGASARDVEVIPDALYHGTAPENVEAILSEGLKPMGRQEVHLSGTPAQAREVGRRHAADPALLEVNAAAMLADGNRISKRGPETYTADAVPPAYLDVREGGGRRER